MNMLSLYPSRETRPLKKCKLGPPDVYGQDGKQREDELSEANLKNGFRYTIPSLDVRDDKTSALTDVTSINPGELQSSIQTMMITKTRQEIFSSESLLKKRPAPSKEHFQNIKPNVNENKVASFFQDLSGAASLSSIIQKKVLVTMRKEDVFENLWQHMVPLDRASWFIKMNNAHHFTAEKRGRKTTDPSTEWTSTLLEFVSMKFKGQQPQLSGDNKGSPQLPQASNAPINTPNNGEQLQYLVQLCFKLYQDGLLDRHVFLRTLIESLEQKKSNEAILAFLPLLMLFVEELLCSQFLSRSLAEFCIRRLRHLHDNDSLYCGEDVRLRSLEGEKRDINLLSYSLTLKLSAILHCVVLECPLALIWLPTETKSSFPLDKLPLDITSLPILPQPDSNISPTQICSLLSHRVQELRERRHAAEMKWSSVGIQASSRGAAVRELVDILDNLNAFKFTDVTSKTRLLELYRKVFHSPDTLQSLSLRDDTIILLLCQWAVAPDQVGRHRPLLVSGLIWARQKERAGLSVDNLLNEFGEFEDDNIETGSVSGSDRDKFPFQRALIRFLDRNESIPAAKPNSPKKGAFLLLCILFSELIQRDLFSFEQYLKFLVARGDFGDNYSKPPTFINKLPKYDIKPPDSCPQPPPRQFLEDISDVIQVKEEFSQSSQSSSQAETGDIIPPPHIKDHLIHITRSNSPKPKPQKGGVLAEDEQQKIPITYHYVVHFPAPDCCDRVEAQRASLLYGIGSMREFCLRVLTATKEEVINFAGARFEQSRTKHILREFCLLPICLQQEVASSCALNYKRNKILSLPKLIFIIELLDLSGSVNKLIEFLFDVIVHMQGEESMKDCHPTIDSPPIRTKELQLSFRMPVVSMLQAYLPSLLASSYHTSHIFERLTYVFEKVKSSDHGLRSDQMRVFLFLNQLYQSCFYLMDAHKDTFGPFQKSLEHTTHSNYQLNPTDMNWNRIFQKNLELEQHSSTDISSTVSTILNLIHKRVVDYPPFSLMCELFAQACNANSVDNIRDLAHILADVCSECPSLNNMFMEAVRAICAPCTKHGFKDLQQYILPDKQLQHNKLVIFIVFVVFHNPLLLPNLVDSVMTAACQYHRSPESSEHQSNALDITCLLILSILTEEGRPDSTRSTPTGSDDWHPFRVLPLYVKRFLYVQNQHLPLSSVSELLKQMIQLLDSFGNTKTGSITNHKKFSKCLEAVVSQSWVREKCQCEVEQLALALTEKEKDLHVSGTIPGMGNDPKLKSSLVKLLTTYICYQGKHFWAKDDKSQVIKILESLDLWNLRFSLIQLFVLLQLTPQQQVMRITDTISQSAFDVFSQKQEQHSREDTGEIDIYRIAPAWLVAPLVSRLPGSVHGRILKLAGDHSKGEWWTMSPVTQTSEYKNGGGASGKQQPFLELVLACLHSGSQEELLDPLSKQVTSFLKAPAEEKQPSDPKARSHLNASLKVRLGLVGSLLNIARQNACQEWCSLLTQLICSGAVDPDHTGTQELHTTTLDMLCILYRSLVNENSSNFAAREPRKYFMDQLKHELNQSTMTSSKCIRELSQLIGASKPALQMKLFSRYNNQGFDPDELVEYTLPAWDVLEGFPHNNMLSLSHYLKFIRHEPGPLKYEEQYRMCLLHTHANKNYFPYCVMLPEAHDTPITPIQSAIPIQDIDQIVITPTESPTAKKQKRISTSSNKDFKRQEQLTPLDIKPQLMMGANQLESGMTLMRPSHPPPQGVYGPGRNIASLQSFPNYQPQQQQQQHLHQQQQQQPQQQQPQQQQPHHSQHQQLPQQQDKFSMRGYNPEDMLGTVDQLNTYNHVNPAGQQQYSMNNPRMMPRGHINMATSDPSSIMSQKYMMDYGMQSTTVNPSINYVQQPGMPRYNPQAANTRQRQLVVQRHRQLARPISTQRYSVSNMISGAGGNVHGGGVSHYNMYFDQSTPYQNQTSGQYPPLSGVRQQGMVARPQSQIITQPNNQGLMHNQMKYIND
ncbi:Mediator of RNA polymerase II transcription subunit 12-like protein [Oopsacas minuta]|uniref:Mediator of RNA polymerase II transcription subunit 12-like protein n=1 Tax=Oopsacas minuta TaxID=111878 RepID=A0AAV7K4V7_9METZ|nr:Mediator of RNA polymerase II transcription subunit 12-like protein [Oopsacas minuta]